jgi:hypothetical protein
LGDWRGRRRGTRDRHRVRTVDLVRDYALALPMAIGTEILGVPTRDRDRFHKWSTAIVSLTSLSGGVRALPSVWMFLRYLRRFVEARRADPKEDLASALIQAEEAGDKLSEDVRRSRSTAGGSDATSRRRSCCVRFSDGRSGSSTPGRTGAGHHSRVLLTAAPTNTASPNSASSSSFSFRARKQ